MSTDTNRPDPVFGRVVQAMTRLIAAPDHERQVAFVGLQAACSEVLELCRSGHVTLEALDDFYRRMHLALDGQESIEGALVGLGLSFAPAAP